MSNRVFTEHLLQQCKHLQKASLPVKCHPNSTKAAVIIEPRRHAMLESVVRNIMHHLGANWNLHIWTYSRNESWVRNLFPDWELHVHSVPFPNMNQTLYNGYLLDPYFWDTLSEEHILIFQTDCLLFRSIPSEMFAFDYVGANYYRAEHIAPSIGGIQGGLSLRKRSAMADCLRRVSWDTIQHYRISMGLPKIATKHEDIFFTHACEMLKKQVPPPPMRSSFSIEAEFYDRPCGHHGYHLPYFTEQQALQIISQSEGYLASC